MIRFKQLGLKGLEIALILYGENCVEKSGADEGANAVLIPEEDVWGFELLLIQAGEDWFISEEVGREGWYANVCQG